MRYWIKQVLIAVDQLVNALLGGWADETLSSRAYRLRHLPFWSTLHLAINTLFFWDYEKRGALTVRHCELAYISETERLQCPPEMRT